MISKTIGEANCHGGSDAVACDIAERKTDRCGWCKAQQRGSTPQGDAIAETLMLQARNALSDNQPGTPNGSVSRAGVNEIQSSDVSESRRQGHPRAKRKPR
jgi:hypothetical protein